MPDKDEVNPDKIEFARQQRELFEQARREGRLVEIPLTEEEKRPILLEGDEVENGEAP
jgi:hypothetical protein